MIKTILQFNFKYLFGLFILAILIFFTVSYSIAVVTAPDAPTGLSGTPTGSRVALSWTAPVNNGGSAITDYLVEFQSGSNAWQTFNDGVSTGVSATVTGLTAATSYNFRVSAINSAGTGTASATLTLNLCTNLNAMNNISGLILWLRADCVDGTPTAPSNGTSISTWRDLSGNGNNATTLTTANHSTYTSVNQSSPTFQNGSTFLINNLPVLNFTRTNDTSGTVMIVSGIDIRATTLPDISVFVVYKPRRANNDATDILGVWGNDNGNWDRFFLAKFANLGDDGLVSRGPGSSNVSTTRITNAGVDLTTRLLTAIYDGTVTSGSNSGPTDSSKVYFGSTLIRSFTDTTDASAARDRLFIGWDGDGSAFRGDIAEFIVFNSALTSDLPTLNSYLNDRYNLGLDVTTDLPDVIPVDPRSTTINFPSLTLSSSTNAMICFRQVSNSSGSDISGSPTISVSRSSATSGVTENTATNLWRYNGARADVQTQISSIQISGTGGNPVVSSGSKWLEVHVTSRTASATDCTTNIQQRKRVELRAIGLDTTRRITVGIN